MQKSLNDLPPGLSLIGEEEATAVGELLRSKQLSPKWAAPKASYTELFEKQLSDHIGANECLVVNSGTSALIVSLVGLGVQQGDEVLIPSFTWISTALAVIAVGAVPIVVKIDDSLNLSVSDLKSRITKKTKAVIVVHMRGSPANMEPIMSICRSANIFVVEDVAQSLGGQYGSKFLGSIGDIGAFSFQTNKILTCGEGGAIATSNEEFFKRCVIYHDTDNYRSMDSLTRRGFNIDGITLFPGVNFRLAEVLACILHVQIQKLTGAIQKMKDVKHFIMASLNDLFQQQGVSWKHEWDKDGDTGLAVIFFLDQSSRASQISAFLREHAVNSYTLDSIRRKDLHNAGNWNPILGRGNDGQERQVVIDDDVVNETTEVLSRAVQIELNPRLTIDDGSLIAKLLTEAIEKAR